VDVDSETHRLKIWLFVGAVVLISAVMSCTEIRYAIWGQTAEATIQRTHEVQIYRRHGMSETKLAVEYEFSEQDGTERKEVMNQEMNWPVPADHKIKVQYLPGVWRASRLVGEWNYIAVSVFVVSFGVAMFFVVKTWREASR
jgi:hypothetical protein